MTKNDKQTKQAVTERSHQDPAQSTPHHTAAAVQNWPVSVRPSNSSFGTMRSHPADPTRASIPADLQRTATVTHTAPQRTATVSPCTCTGSPVELADKADRPAPPKRHHHITPAKQAPKWKGGPQEPALLRMYTSNDHASAETAVAHLFCSVASRSMHPWSPCLVLPVLRC